MLARMAAFCLISLLLAGSGCLVASAEEPLLAFPGAMGTGRYAVGGRGGEVYHVTRLDDPLDELVEGSLRHAMATADGPRTIVFDIGGIISLRRPIDARHKSNLTIAGQTAPGGGITIGDNSFFIRNSSDIIIQNIRFAPGDAATRLGSEDLPGHSPRGSVVALRLWNVNNAIVDHVTGRWASECTISTTHGSRNVTVQYSFISQGLHKGDHEKGPRGYGSLVTGGPYSYLANLYAQNRGRNPRVVRRDDDEFDTLAEFNNNLIYHASDAAGVFTGGVRINYTGNLAIAGPSRSRAPAMVHGWGDSRPVVYATENFYDVNSGSSLNLEGSSGQVLRDPEQAGEPFAIDSNHSPVSVRQAYIDVLSRGGASLARDFHDKRLVKEVVERGGSLLDRPADAGGHGTVESGERVVSTARDGIADWWKLHRGLDVNRQYHQDYGPDGYTVLEQYLHSLMEPLRISHKVQQVVIAAGEFPQEEWPAATGKGNHLMLKFDLSSIRPGSVKDARLDIGGVPAGAAVQARDPMISADQWNPGNSIIPVEKYAKTPWRLGEFSTQGSFDSPNLAVFLNSALRHYGNSPDRLIVTILIEAGDELGPADAALVIEVRQPPG